MLKEAIVSVKNKFYTTYGKRIFDLALTIPTLIILSPIFILTALLVLFSLGFPVIFKQTRPGLNEKPFVILKFRTMTNARDVNGSLLPDTERLTRLGIYLRKTSIDEIPELFNVLKGEMSTVGPRPLYKEYLPYYSQREKLRHSVRPGITGLSQVSGRNYLLWDERLEMDAHYVEKMSFLLDIKIIFRTVFQVATAKNVAAVQRLVSVSLLDYRKQKKMDKNHYVTNGAWDE